MPLAWFRARLVRVRRLVSRDAPGFSSSSSSSSSSHGQQGHHQHQGHHHHHHHRRDGGGGGGGAGANQANAAGTPGGSVVDPAELSRQRTWELLLSAARAGVMVAAGVVLVRWAVSGGAGRGARVVGPVAALGAGWAAASGVPVRRWAPVVAVALMLGPVVGRWADARDASVARLVRKADGVLRERFRADGATEEAMPPHIDAATHPVVLEMTPRRVTLRVDADTFTSSGQRVGTSVVVVRGQREYPWEEWTLCEVEVDGESALVAANVLAIVADAAASVVSSQSQSQSHASSSSSSS